MSYREHINYVQSELKLREAVEELGIDTPAVRSFLEKTANDYMRAFGKKGRIVRIYAPKFVVEIKMEKEASKYLRVPVVDFFKGESDVAQRDYAIKDAIDNYRKRDGATILYIDKYRDVHVKDKTKSLKEKHCGQKIGKRSKRA